MLSTAAKPNQTLPSNNNGTTTTTNATSSLISSTTTNISITNTSTTAALANNNNNKTTATTTTTTSNLPVSNNLNTNSTNIKIENGTNNPTSSSTTTTISAITTTTTAITATSTSSTTTTSQTKPTNTSNSEKELRWIFPKEKIENTPSRLDGISADEELNYRQEAALFISDLGIMLKVNQLCINTAIIYMHRFYMIHSFKKFHRYMVATSCLFFACKVEEQPRRLREFIEAIQKIFHPKTANDPNISSAQANSNHADEFRKYGDEIVALESCLIQTLGFNVLITHAHTIIIKTCQMIKASRDLAEAAYLTATNSLMLTNFCVKFSSEKVACFCIYLACKWIELIIPPSSEGLQWYQYVRSDIVEQELEDISKEYLSIFTKCPPRIQKKLGRNRTQDEINRSTSSTSQPPNNKQPLPPHQQMQPHPQQNKPITNNPPPPSTTTSSHPQNLAVKKEPPTTTTATTTTTTLATQNNPSIKKEPFHNQAHSNPTNKLQTTPNGSTNTNSNSNPNKPYNQNISSSSSINNSSNKTPNGNSSSSNVLPQQQPQNPVIKSENINNFSAIKKPVQSNLNSISSSTSSTSLATSSMKRVNEDTFSNPMNAGPNKLPKYNAAAITTEQNQLG